MDQFLLENTQLYLRLVERFQPTAPKTNRIDEDKFKSIVIAARIRPLLNEEISTGAVSGIFPRDGEPGVLDLHELRKTVRGTAALNVSLSHYLVDKAFSSDDTTETIYDDMVRPLVPWAWSGGVSTIFAYGQTGSGKTHTISGLERLVANALFDGASDGTRNIFVSIVELAGNSAFDLLNARKPVSILEDTFGTTHLAGASEYHIIDSASLVKHIDYAASFRQTASTQKNDASSRSHSICKIRLENPSLPQAEDGLIFLVDLAGSEAARDVSAHSSDRMKEAREINASLSVLKDCIRGTANLDGLGGVVKATPGRKAYIPFRQTALTKLLKHVFDPAATRSCKTAVIACLNPSLADVGASKNTLRYAKLLRVVSPKAVPLEYDPAKPITWSNHHLQGWIEKNSGAPPVLAALLAPFETGKQLLRLPAPEFITRCLKTPGISTEQAVAFQAKFWRLHVDSQRPSGGTHTTEEGKQGPGSSVEPGTDWTHTSRDARPDMQTLPFKQRLRPGMVVVWTPPEGTSRLASSAMRNLMMLLAAEADADVRAYRCAVVAPGVMPGAFELHPWLQCVVEERHMQAEVILEYDSATRYYYETL
ncbi:P-loop containing nucleoside triphosphate hydrolase protein [Macrophomina phaseolina]|uniref:P-loop containing nucleoside triphosphate hydrolase protein n=1 Tax=Macrophomina phaseolina TaxID=35725 RepID=A0ABQ8FQB7_9PEZI|nr:P-loop containing nucleoside triphosphate hydrolase protein [Macrophomina phaseolina]